MATFTAGTSFTDGVTGDVTAAKLNALVANATPLSNFITDRTAETSIATDDLVLISDTSDSGALNKMTVANFTNVVSTGTGTAASPAIRPTGDTNTGIFFPAADTAAIATQGTEAMRIDSSGNVGIGTASPSSILHISKTGAAFPSSSNPRIRLDEVSSGRFGIIEFDSSTNLNIWGSDAGSGSIRFFNGAGDGTERLRIDSSGNVGIGITDPSNYNANGNNLVVGDTASSNGITITSGTASSGGLFFADEKVTGFSGYLQYDHSSDYIRIATNATERLRIDSSGRVGIGTTSPAYNLDVRGSNNVYLAAMATGSANNTTVFIRADTDGVVFGQTGTSATPIIFDQAGTERLRITSGGEVYIAGTTDQGAYNLQVNGTGVWGAGAYVNGSDERLKENIQDITSGLDVVEKLRPVSFQYKEEYTADRSIQSGFIAQDLLVALEGKNYLEGVVSQGPTYYNVAYQNLIPILAKAIQELKTINNSQAQTITSLESRIAALEAA